MSILDADTALANHSFCVGDGKQVVLPGALRSNQHFYSLATAQTGRNIQTLETRNNFQKERSEIAIPNKQQNTQIECGMTRNRNANPLGISAPSLSSVILDIQDDIIDNNKEISIVEEMKRSLESNQECKCPRIIVTDDDPFNHMALEGLFMIQGIKGNDRAYNGKEALEKIEANYKTPKCKSQRHKPYDIIILDNNMPILTGIPTAKKIRIMQKQGQISNNLKLVLFSGDDFTGMHLSQYDKGQMHSPPHVTSLFDYILSKPVTKAAFEDFFKKFPNLKISDYQ